jgi:general secretion pathway protein A
MYKRFFGLRENPFNVNPDPRYLFATKSVRESLAALTYGIQNRKGFVLLTGEVGTGKTTLLNRLLGWLHGERVATAFVFNSLLNANELLDFILADFEIPCKSRDKSQVLLTLNHWLLERYRAGGTAVVVVDEAQNLSFEVLEEIRLLTNLETSTEKLLQIVLSGQPELEDKLRLPELRQLRQRFTLRCRTCPLTPEETCDYVADRLRKAGANGDPIFSKEALQLVHQYSKGIPRLVNLLCEHSLIGAYVEHLRPIPARLVEEVAQEFELDESEHTSRLSAGSEPSRTANTQALVRNLDELIGRLRRTYVVPPVSQ